MAISLNNHESRIKTLETKLSSIGTVETAKIAQTGYVKFSNGLIIQWGAKTQTFPIAFPTACLMVMTCPRMQSRTENTWNSDSAVSSFSKTTYTTYNLATDFIAFGY